MFEHRITFAHPEFGTLTGFANIDSIQTPISGAVTVYCPSVRKYIDTDWSKAISVMLVGADKVNAD